jgi:hypothetical protein
MKYVLFYVVCAAVLISAYGCQQHKPQGYSNKYNDFPSFLVGVWQAKVTKQSEWGFKFESDGSISKMIHSLAGKVRLADGGVYLPGPEENTYATFIPGECTINYDRSTQILKVTIVLDYYEMKLPNGTLKGHCEDVFEGPISPDGNAWQAKWRSYSYLEGASEPDRVLVDANPVSLTFTKLSI